MTEYEHDRYEHDTQRIETDELDNPPRHRGPNAFTLLVGLVALAASAYALTDGHIWLPPVDPRWVIAGGALVFGLALLAASLRPNRRR